MSQPKDYPDGSQIIVNNGRVNNLFQMLNAIIIVLIPAVLIWGAVTLTELNTKVAVLISQNESVREVYKNDQSRTERRLAALERAQWGVERINSGDK